MSENMLFVYACLELIYVAGETVPEYLVLDKMIPFVQGHFPHSNSPVIRIFSIGNDLGINIYIWYYIQTSLYSIRKMMKITSS